jgi:hypothetical protein
MHNNETSEYSLTPSWWWFTGGSEYYTLSTSGRWWIQERGGWVWMGAKQVHDMEPIWKGQTCAVLKWNALSTPFPQVVAPPKVE